MDKARYVHANYRFIVAPDRAYHAQAANADVHLDWNSVLQVLVSEQTQAASCPICLSAPVAPRMARCGHIFCLPCLIRYMHSTDDDHPVPERKARWKTCPVCWDTIYITETRPVRWFRGQEGDLPVEGSDVVLRLVKREPGSTLALPRDGAESLAAGEDIPWHHAAEVADYARIMKGGEDYMNSQHDAEIEGLRRQEVEDELLFGDDTTWSHKAIAAITEAKQRVRGMGNPPEAPRQPVPKKSLRDSVPLESPGQVAGAHAAPHDVESGNGCPTDYVSPSTAGPDLAFTPGTSGEADRLSDAMNNVQLEPSTIAQSKQRDPGASRPQDAHGPHGTDQPYYFYQALPQFYLSPLDIRILKAAFGEYASFPATILPRVEHISTGHIIDDELRKRVKYLGHLPYGCEVNFLECDWRDVVGPEVLRHFHAETQKRRKRNKEKEVREEKDRVRAEKEEDDKRWAAAHRKRPSIPSSDRPFSDKDFQPLNGGIPVGSPPFDIGSSSISPPQRHGFGALASPSNSPPGARTVWGTTAVRPQSPQAEPQAAARPNDGWLQDWEDELMAQQENEAIAQSTTEGSNAPPGGKKKKKNKITLMSTNSQRGA